MRGGRGIEGRGLDGFPPRPRALTAETVDGCGRRSPAGTCAVQCRVWIRRQAAHGYAPFGCRTAGSGKHGGRAFMEPVSAMARITFSGGMKLTMPGPYQESLSQANAAWQRLKLAIEPDPREGVSGWRFGRLFLKRKTQRPSGIRTRRRHRRSRSGPACSSCLDPYGAPRSVKHRHRCPIR